MLILKVIFFLVVLFILFNIFYLDGKCLKCGKREKGVFRGDINTNNWYCSQCREKLS